MRIAVNGKKHKDRMCGGWQLPDQLYYLRGICFFYDSIIDKWLVGCFQFAMAEPAALFYMIQRFVDDDLFEPGMKGTFGFVKRMNAPEHFYKSMAQYISCFLRIGGITHGYSHGKCVMLPVQ